MTNAPSGAGDRYYVYRPMLDLIGKNEGADKGRGYKDTLGYGIMLDGKVTKGKGPTINLASMTLDRVDALQTRMLKNPDKRRLNSSTIGPIPGDPHDVAGHPLAASRPLSRFLSV